MPINSLNGSTPMHSPTLTTSSVAISQVTKQCFSSEVNHLTLTQPRLSSTSSKSNVTSNYCTKDTSVSSAFLTDSLLIKNSTEGNHTCSSVPSVPLIMTALYLDFSMGLEHGMNNIRRKFLSSLFCSLLADFFAFSNSSSSLVTSNTDINSICMNVMEISGSLNDKPRFCRALSRGQQLYKPPHDENVSVLPSKISRPEL